MTMQAEITMNPVSVNAFAWNELATRDPEKSGDFYRALFGWTSEEAECTAGYTIFSCGGLPVAGMVIMDDKWPTDAPSHWGSYISVKDVDATAALVTNFGGSVCCEPMDAGDSARMAVLTDPTGAVISLYQGGDGKNACGHGSFCWNELLTNDMDTAAAFYSKLFGWVEQKSEASPEPYSVFMNGEEWAGGLMKMHWEGNPSWLGYISVADVDVATSKAIELGASVCVEPSDIPSIGRFAVFTDPVGATVAVFTALSECSGDSCECS